MYDWCHRLLTAEEKPAFIKERVRLAKTQECGYPPRRHSITVGGAFSGRTVNDIRQFPDDISQLSSGRNTECRRLELVPRSQRGVGV
jgi:hypothetical protein